MKQPSLPAKSLFAKHSVILFAFLMAFVTATYSQVGINALWTWKKGPKVILDEGDNGTMGFEASTNVPMSRHGGNTFRDNNGNLWLFGGMVFFPVFFQPITLSDLWKYDPTTNNWTWVKEGGANYGILGVPASSNYPPNRNGAASWVDNNGNFWLFGGSGTDGFLNDLWKYDVSTNNWTWISGSNTINASGNYGVQGVAASSNMPPATSYMAFWGDNVGNLWFYGGGTNSGSMDNLWRYNIANNTWTWIKGNTTANQPPVYGTKGIPAASNTPGGRGGSSAWIDAGNNLYLFGGGNNTSYNNDLWKFNPSTNQWTWIHGDNVPSQPSVMGTQGVTHQQNKPGARFGSSVFNDLQGNFWLFGGQSFPTTYYAVGALNDLWKYSPTTNQWTWMKGGELNAYGVYGTQGVPAATNKPGSRWGAMSWSSPSSEFWLFGGDGYAETMGPNAMNDLWNINSNTLLPIKLISFNGKMQQGIIQLQWQAEDVNSSDLFIIERSLDGRSFSSAGSVRAISLQKNYKFDDNISTNTTALFYRIKVVEQDNHFFYSKVLSFSLPKHTLTIYPNPAKSHIWFALPVGEMINASYSVIDASGRISLQGELATTSINKYSIDVSKLPAGNYIVSIKTKKGTVQASFIKQ